MSEREHTSKQFEQQLRALKDKLLLMSHHAEKMIADAIRALVERRPSLAEDVIKSDDTMDQLELEIDNLCYEILALEQPVARDLRFIATALKIVRDIERIGDIAVNIAERATELIQEPETEAADRSADHGRSRAADPEGKPRCICELGCRAGGKGHP